MHKDLIGPCIRPWSSWILEEMISKLRPHSFNYWDQLSSRFLCSIIYPNLGVWRPWWKGNWLSAIPTWTHNRLPSIQYTCNHPSMIGCWPRRSKFSFNGLITPTNHGHHINRSWRFIVIMNHRAQKVIKYWRKLNPLHAILVLLEWNLRHHRSYAIPP